MHAYIKENVPIKRIYFFLAFISIALSMFLSSHLPNLKFEFIHKIIPYLSPFTIYFFIYWIFDKYVWKWISSFINIADISGEYNGTFKTSYDNFRKKRQFKLKIEQTFSQILIEFNTDSSSSKSLNAYIKVEGKNTVYLIYNYHNIPRRKSIATLTEHKGTVWLKFNLSTKKFEGFYYTDKRPREGGGAECNYGEMAGEKLK